MIPFRIFIKNVKNWNFNMELSFNATEIKTIMIIVGRLKSYIPNRCVFMINIFINVTI